MRITAIELDNTAKVTTVVIDGMYQRQFAAAVLQPADVERFLADAEDARQRVYDCRAIFMSGGNIIPFPQADGDGGTVAH